MVLTTSETDVVRGYELGDRLGEGAFSVVYRGRQPSVDREVAIKQIRAELANRPDFIRRFQAEAQLVARLEHPHIVPLHDFWREPGSAYLVMRFLRGGSLEAALLDGPWDLVRTAAMVDQIAGALETAHESGVVHRDVKSANILLDERGNAYLGDFGIALEAADVSDPATALSAGSPAYAPPEQLRGEPVGPPADIHGLAVVVFEALTGRLPFPEESTRAGLLQRQLNDPIPALTGIRDDLPPGIDDVVATATAKDPVDRYQTAREFAADMIGLVESGTMVARTLPVAVEKNGGGLRGQGRRSGSATMVAAEQRNPYKGLRAFDEADSADFVGRDSLTAQLVEAVDENRFVAVVGPSGSGKSSVVRAGLLPTIRKGAVSGSESWFPVAMTPGTDPYAALEAALLSIATEHHPNLEDILGSDQKGIARGVRQVLGDGQVLLVIDQFEELFTLCADDELRTRFLDGLVAALTDERSQMRVVATLRADFYDRPLRHPGLGRLVRDATIPILPLAPDELEQVITEPAARVGANFEVGLVAEIVADVADQPGALPLLQYALTELYEQRDDNTLTRDAYRELGGIGGALGRRADELYETADPTDQAAIRAMFARLITPGEGTEDTRRRATRRELNAASIIDTYGAARLLSFDRDADTREPTVEVAHEALIREWPRLRGWLDEDRDGLRILRHLTDTAGSWDTSGQPDGELYRAGRLQAAQEWAADREGDLTDTEAAFLTASTERQQTEQDTERQTNRRLRRLLTGVAIVAVLALIAGGIAFAQQREASTQRDLASTNATEAEENADEAERNAEQARAEADRADTNAEEARQQTSEADLRRMVAESVDLVDSDERLALLVALAAYQTDPTPATLGAIQRVLLETPRGWQMGIDSTVGQLVGAEFVSGDRLVIAGTEGLSIVDPATGSEIRRLDYTDTIALDAARRADRVVIAIDDGWTMLDSSTWDVVASGSHGVGIRTVGVSDDGKTIAVSESGGSVIVAQVDNPTVEAVVVPFADGSEFAHTLRFDPTGERLAMVGAGAGGAAIWELATETWIANGIRLGPSEMIGIAYDAIWDGDQLWVSGLDAVVAVDGRTGRFIGERQRVEEVDRWLLVDNGGNLVSGTGLGSLFQHDNGQLTPAAEAGSNVTGIVGVEASVNSPLAAITTPREVTVLSLDGSAGLVQHRFPANGDVVRITESGSTLVNENPTAGGAMSEPRFFDLNEATPIEQRLPPTERIARWTYPYDQGENFFIFGEDANGTINRIGLWEDGVLRDVPHEWAPIEGALMVAIELSPGNTHAVIAEAQLGLPGPVRVLDLQTGEFVAHLDAIEQVYDEGMEFPFAMDAEFTPDGERLVVTTGSQTVQVYDTDDWSHIGEMISTEDGFFDIVFSRDGKTALTWSRPAGLAIRDAETLEVLAGPSADGLSMRSSLNGQMLDYVADERYAIKNSANAGNQVIDLETLEPVGAPFPFDTDMRNAAVAREASIMGTVVGDEVIVWNVNPDEWPEIACSMANRNMTEDEWERFGPIDQPYQETCPN